MKKEEFNALSKEEKEFLIYNHTRRTSANMQFFTWYLIISIVFGVLVAMGMRV